MVQRFSNGAGRSGYPMPFGGVQGNPYGYSRGGYSSNPFGRSYGMPRGNSGSTQAAPRRNPFESSYGSPYGSGQSRQAASRQSGVSPVGRYPQTGYNTPTRSPYGAASTAKAGNGMSAFGGNGHRFNAQGMNGANVVSRTNKNDEAKAAAAGTASAASDAEATAAKVREAVKEAEAKAAKNAAEAKDAEEAAEAQKSSAEQIIEDAEAVIEDVAAEVESESAALEEARKEAADWQDRYMRLHAEWDTYRRRTNEQRAEEKTRANEKLIEDLLPVLDDFERTVAYATENGEAGLLDGVKAVQNKLIDSLKKDGLEVIDPVGEPYDALEAQAVATVPDEEAYDETVKDVYQKGYKLGNKVIRPAMVTVSTGGPSRDSDNPSSSSEQG